MLAIWLNPKLRQEIKGAN